MSNTSNDLSASGANKVLHFWFQEITPQARWKADPEFDKLIAARFSGVLQSACLGELFAWRGSAAGRLAEIIVLDQFSRNVFRGQAQAFAQDPMALALAQEAVAAGHDTALPPEERVFMYMPYMHSESRLIHIEAERLFAALGIAQNYEYELRHKVIVDRFGRYPHRNAILGRTATAQEAEFLLQPNSSF